LPEAKFRTRRIGDWGQSPGGFTRRIRIQGKFKRFGPEKRYSRQGDEARDSSRRRFLGMTVATHRLNQTKGAASMSLRTRLLASGVLGGLSGVVLAAGTLALLSVPVHAQTSPHRGQAVEASMANPAAAPIEPR
jgi:hypothetical protein